MSNTITPYQKSKQTNIAKKQPPSVSKPEQQTKTLPDIIGGPPESGGKTNKIDLDIIRRNASLLIHIEPCVTGPETGISLFRLDPAWDKYKNMLKDVGFSPSSNQDSRKCITISVMAESFPSDTFSNEYGEHFLNTITDIGGQGFGQLAQMMGKETGTEALKELGKLGKTAGKQIGGTLGNAIGGLGGGIATIADKGHETIRNWSKQEGVMGSIGKSMNQLIAGARIDFPQIWKNSSYNPTFSCTLRLYNPNPGNKEITKKYIIGPLAALLTLVLPHGNDQSGYTWPFFCRVDCKGLFKIPMGAITNITITKGGDSGLIAFNQRVSIVDVRMDFINLHGTMILAGKNFADKRPTLKGYLDNMLDNQNIDTLYLKDDYNLSMVRDDQIRPRSVGITPSTAIPIDTSSAPAPRVDETKKAQETDLKNRSVGGP